MRCDIAPETIILSIELREHKAANIAYFCILVNVNYHKYLSCFSSRSFLLCLG